MLGRILAGIVFITTPALGQSPRGVDYAFVIADANGNQRISEREYVHFQGSLLLAIDQNSDGQISAIEWRDWDPREFSGPEEESIGRLVAAMGRLFVASDKNKDDLLSGAEFAAAMFLSYQTANTSGGELDRSE